MDDAELGETFVGLIFVIILMGIYFIPTIISICRKSYHATSAIIVNALLGWTCIGWIVALVLSLLNKPDKIPQQIVINQVVGDKNSFPKNESIEKA